MVKKVKQKKPELIIDGKKYYPISHKNSEYFYKHTEFDSKSTVIDEYILKDENEEFFKLEEPRNKDKKLYVFSKLDKNMKVIKKLEFKEIKEHDYLDICDYYCK